MVSGVVSLVMMFPVAAVAFENSLDATEQGSLGNSAIVNSGVMAQWDRDGLEKCLQIHYLAGNDKVLSCGGLGGSLDEESLGLDIFHHSQPDGPGCLTREKEDNNQNHCHDAYRERVKCMLDLDFNEQRDDPLLTSCVQGFHFFSDVYTAQKELKQERDQCQDDLQDARGARDQRQNVDEQTCNLPCEQFQCPSITNNQSSFRMAARNSPGQECVVGQENHCIETCCDVVETRPCRQGPGCPRDMMPKDDFTTQSCQFRTRRFGMGNRQARPRPEQLDCISSCCESQATASLAEEDDEP